MVRENVRMPIGTAVISCVPTKVSRKPRKTLSVPSVTISVGSFKVAMKNPLISPSASPIAPATRKATRIESPMPNATIALVPTYIAKAAIAVNDTSMPPEASTRSTPTANSAVTMPLRSRSNRVESERKLGSDPGDAPAQTASQHQAHQCFVAGEETAHHRRLHPASRAARAVLFRGRAGDCPPSRGPTA